MTGESEEFAFRDCDCGWRGRADQCPKDEKFGYSRCPKCRSMVGTGLHVGKRPKTTKRAEKP